MPRFMVLAVVGPMLVWCLLEPSGGSCHSPFPARSGVVVPSAPPSAGLFTNQRQVWTAAQGLPHNRVQCLLQSRDGYLWMGTYGGLARFDGIRFVVHNRANTPSMVSEDCTALAEGVDGTLWVGTRDGLLRYRRGRVVRYTTAEGLADNAIGLLCATPHGHVGIASRRGLDCWDGTTFTRVITFNDPESERIHALTAGPDGRLWIGSRWRFQTYDPRAKTLGKDLRDPRTGEHAVVGMRAISSSECWLYSLGLTNRLLRHFEAGSWTDFPVDLNVELAGWPNFILPDRSGGLWMSAGRFGLDRFQDGQFLRFTEANGLADDWVLSCCQDREGNLWIGTESGGLNRWQPRRIQSLTRAEGLAHDNAWTICEGPDGCVWIGTDGGLSRFSKGGFAHYTEARGLARSTVRALTVDRSGRVWIGTGGGGVDCLDEGRIANHRLPGDLSGNKIRVLFEDHDGRIWAGAERGLHCYQNGQWATYTTAEGLSHNDVRALHADQAGRLWIGTYGGGLNRFSEGRFAAFRIADGLPSDSVWAIHQDAEGTLWLGTENGLSRYASGQFSNFGIEEGLHEPTVNHILEDDQDHLWLSGEHGVYRVRKAELTAAVRGNAGRFTVAVYGATDGMFSTETNGQKSQPAGCKTRDGRLWFPTTCGVAIVDPQRLNADSVAPAVVIEQVRTGERQVFADGVISVGREQEGRSHNDSPSPGPGSEGPLRLPPDSGHVIEFQYTANTFVAPEKARFRYRLEGYDEAWHDAGTRRVAYYTNLRPGHYGFRVTACNSHGAWSESEAVFAFQLEPFFHQTHWFYALCGLGVVSAGWGLHRLRVSVLRRIHALERQTALQQERARIAHDIHDDLGARLTQIRLWSAWGGPQVAGSRPAGAPAERMQKTADEAIQALNEVIWAVDPDKDTVDDLAGFISHYAERFLHPTPIRLRLEMDEDLPRFPMPSRTRHSLFLVAKEALNNVVRHASATEVRIRLQVSDSMVSLSVEDNGRGFERTERAANGNGLANMCRRAEEIGGTFQIRSQPGSGTTIGVLVNLPHEVAHLNQRRPRTNPT